MKKFIYLAIALIALPFALTSCSDDDDLPNVDYTIAISGGVMDQTDNVIYVVQGDTLNIESLGVKNLDSNKVAAITGADYYWDYTWLGASTLPPYGFSIAVTDATPVGKHLLQIKTGVVAVDKEPAIGIVAYEVNVVADAADLPNTATGRSFTVTPGMKAN